MLDIEQSRELRKKYFPTDNIKHDHIYELIETEENRKEREKDQ